MTTKTIFPTLTALGLSPNEAKIYTSVLEYGASDISTIARHASITRVTAYALIKNLLKDKYIIETKRHTRVLYQAIDPKNLITKLEEICNEGVQALSTISIQQNKKLFIPEIKTYSGAKDLLKIYDDVGMTLPKNGTYFRYTSRIQEQGRSSLYSKLRVEKELERLVITSEKKSASKGKDPNRFIKTVPKDFAFDDDVTVLIYGTKIAHIDFNSNTGIIIESPHLARFQEKLFKLLWRRL